MTDSAKHSKLPWRTEFERAWGWTVRSPEQVHTVDGYADKYVAHRLDKANAQLIVSAVNSHHALVEAVERVLQRHDQGIPLTYKDFAMLEAAIAKAQENPND